MSARASYLVKKEVTISLPRDAVVKSSTHRLHTDIVVSVADAVSLYHALKDLLASLEDASA